MPWTPLPRIAFAIATYPFNPTTRDDLPLELGDELYIIEQCADGQWFRGYLVAPPSLLAGLTSTKGATLEARVFSGIFPASCVDVKEFLSTGTVPPEYAEEEEEEEEEAPDDDDDGGGDNNDDDRDGDENGNNTNHNSTKANKGGLFTEEEIAIAAARNLKRSRSRRKRDSLMRAKNIHGARDRDPDRPRPAAPVPMLKVGDETSSYEGEPLVDEIASCLREWHAANLHELLLNRRYPLLDEFTALVQQLDLSRRQLLNNVLTRQELVTTREDTVWSLVRGNKLLSREIIVRDPESGRILTGEDSSVEIATLQSIMSLLDEPPKLKSDDVVRKHHLQLEHRAFVGIGADPTTVVYYLATKSNHPVSEAFTVELDIAGRPIDTAQVGKLQALFTDVSARDAEDLYLVARVYTNSTVACAGPNSGTIKANGSEGGTVKASSHNRVASPTREEKKLKGRVSVLFNPRPKTPGKENDGRVKSAGKNHTNRHDENRPPSAATPSPSPPPPPPVPCLRPKKITFRKAIGVGVLDVGKFIMQDQGTEQIMHIFVPSRITTNGLEKAGEKGGGGLMGRDKHCQDSGENWDRMVREVIEARIKSPSVPEPLMGTNYRKSLASTDMRLPQEKNPKADKLHLYMKPYAANDAEELVRSMPTVLHQIAPTRKIGFTGAPTKQRSDIYITLSSLMIPRHALLVHPKAGPGPLPPSSHFNQLQLSMEVRRNSTGEKIGGSIFSSANSAGLTIWKSAVVTRDETWSQTVRLSLKGEDVPDAHVFLSISGIPNPPAAMAWFPLWNGGSFLKDGEHELVMYRYDEDTALPNGNSSPDSGYISQPWTPDSEGWAAALSMGGAAAFVKVKSFLCSTVFSQDDDLLSLLRWQSLGQDELVDCLKKVVFVPEMEIVKLLREVFDALFEILVENTSKAEIEDLVFNAVVTVLGIVNDRRFNMEPIVDDYTERLFDYPFAAPCLLRSFARLLHDPSHIENSVRLRASFKVGRHMFRFIVKAREKQVLKEATIGINGSQTFTKELRGVFKLLENLMRNADARLVGSQTLAVQHFHQWLPELVGVLSREDILLVAIDFMDSCAGVKGKLVLYKLVLIVNYSRIRLFSQPDDRRALTVNTVRWLEPHWGKTIDPTIQWREQVRLCCSIIAEQTDELGEEVSEYIPKIVDSYRAIQAGGIVQRDSLSLLFPKTYPFPSKSIDDRPVFDEALVELSAVLAAISSIPASLHLILPEDELAVLLMDTLKVHMSILQCEAFPESWLSVHIYQHKSTMRTLENLAGILVDTFLPDPEDAEKFNMDLWQAFFSTLLTLVGSDALALETFPEQKRRAVWKVAGDVREVGADLLRRTWEAIGWETSAEEKKNFGLEKMGGYQVQYVPGLVAPIVELCLSVHEGLRCVAVEVLQTMIISEWTLNEDLSVIQAEMIDSLDCLFKSKRLTESITQKLFVADLIELFKPLALNPEDPLSATVGNLLKTIDEFLDLLVAVHNTPLGEAYQIMDTLRLMDFLKDMRKEDMFIRYVHQLVNVQLSSNNLVEAALSLKLHADLYTWDVNERVPALSDPQFPEQTAFERREQLFLEMIGYYEDGRSWENALETYRELAENYEHTVFEYGKLARCYRAMAKLQEAILDGHRAEPRFYRVAYYGMGFPIGLRDRQFVVQAGPWEGPQMFSDRMLMQHPEARMVDGVVDNVEGQFIQATPVDPEINYAGPAFRKQRVPANVRDYLARRDARAFSAVHQQRETGEADAWTEKTLFVTSEGFPAILKRSEVIETVVVGVSPVERAIADVLRRTKELADLERKFSEYKSPDKSLDMGAFSIALTNAVDASKSVANHRNLLEEHETKEELRDALRTVMADHVAAIKKALGTHGRLVTGGLRGVQSSCAKCFEMTFRKELSEAMPPPLLPISPGQWKQQSYSRDSQMTPVPLLPSGTHVRASSRSNSVVVNANGTGPTLLHAPPPPLTRTRSILSDTGTEKSTASTGRRITSMIFGGSGGGSNGAPMIMYKQPPMLPMLPMPSIPPPPPPPPPESIRSSSTRSRSGSVSTSRSRKSSKGAPAIDRSSASRGSESTDGARPKTPGRIERSVGSVRRRWSQLNLSVNTVGKKTSRGSMKSASSRRGGGSDFGSMVEADDEN